MLVTVDVPDEMADYMGSDNASRSRQMLEALLLQKYVAGEISGGWLGQVLGLSFYEREQFLHDHQAYQHMTVEEYDRDMEAFARLLAK